LEKRPQWDVLEVLTLEISLFIIGKYAIHEGEIGILGDGVTRRVYCFEGIRIYGDILFLCTE